MNDDKQTKLRFTKAMLMAYSAHRMKSEPETIEVYWGLLADYDIDSVVTAIERCLKDPEAGKYFPKVGDIIREIDQGDGGDGRPEPDEAWAMIPHTETASVVWCGEMARAAVAAGPLIDAGDLIAARKAFLDVYRREVAQARSAGTPAKWVLSTGWDVAGRAAAVRVAFERKHIGREAAMAMLGHIGGQRAEEAMIAIGGPEVRARLAPPESAPMLPRAGRSGAGPQLLKELIEKLRAPA